MDISLSETENSFILRKCSGSFTPICAAKQNLRYYLGKKLTRFYKRKSQGKCKLHNQGAFRVLVDKYGLIDPAKYALN